MYSIYDLFITVKHSYCHFKQAWMGNHVAPTVPAAAVSSTWALRMLLGPATAVPIQTPSTDIKDPVTPLLQPIPVMTSPNRALPPGAGYGDPVVEDPLVIVHSTSWTKPASVYIKLKVFRVQRAIWNLLSRVKGSLLLYPAVWIASPHQCGAPKRAPIFPVYLAPVASSPRRRATVGAQVSTAPHPGGLWHLCRIKTHLNWISVTRGVWKKPQT